MLLKGSGDNMERLVEAINFLFTKTFTRRDFYFLFFARWLQFLWFFFYHFSCYHIFRNSKIFIFWGCFSSRLTAPSSPTGKPWLSLSVQMTSSSLWSEVSFKRVKLEGFSSFKVLVALKLAVDLETIFRGQWHCKLCVSPCLRPSHRPIQVFFINWPRPFIIRPIQVPFVNRPIQVSLSINWFKYIFINGPIQVYLLFINRFKYLFINQQIQVRIPFFILSLTHSMKTPRFRYIMPGIGALLAITQLSIFWIGQVPKTHFTKKLNNFFLSS